MAISMDTAKALLDDGVKEAQKLINDPYKVDELLIELENKLREVPAVGEKLSDLPVMISMVKAYITGEYKDVSPKVIVTMIAAFLYLVKGKDLIKDSVPLIGIADDITVLGLAFQFCKQELDQYREYRDVKMAKKEM
jgi:uncharacterized membrane protein YkvA (DUF1232 family)